MCPSMAPSTLLYTCPHTACYVCPHTAIKGFDVKVWPPVHCYICVFMLLYVSSYCLCVLIPLALFVSSYCLCVLTLLALALAYSALLPCVRMLLVQLYYYVHAASTPLCPHTTSALANVQKKGACGP
jgi:hypothetical protein